MRWRSPPGAGRITARSPVDCGAFGSQAAAVSSSKQHLQELGSREKVGREGGMGANEFGQFSSAVETE